MDHPVKDHELAFLAHGIQWGAHRKCLEVFGRAVDLIDSYAEDDDEIAVRLMKPVVEELWARYHDPIA